MLLNTYNGKDKKLEICIESSKMQRNLKNKNVVILDYLKLYKTMQFHV